MIPGFSYYFQLVSSLNRNQFARPSFDIGPVHICLLFSLLGEHSGISLQGNGSVTMDPLQSITFEHAHLSLK